MKLPLGFVAGSCAAGLKSSGALDLTLIANVGPSAACAGVFTTNKMKAAPVLWTQQVVVGGAVRAVILNSGGANACTGSQGFADTHRTAEYVGEILEISSSEVAVCSTGLIGEYLPMAKVLQGVAKIAPQLSDSGLVDAATAIMTTDTHPKIASVEKFGVQVTGIAKGAGMLAPSMATMLSVVMTDALLPENGLSELFASVVDSTYNRIDSDGCTSTNDTVLLLGSGSSGIRISEIELHELLIEVCGSLSHQLISDAEGHTKVVSIKVVGALSESDAVNVGRACARNNLLKCALFGGDPNWGRILAALGTADAEFDAYNIDVELNGIMVARSSAPGDDRSKVDLSGPDITIIIDLKMGTNEATIYTNDLSHDYVHENSAYAT